MNQDIKLMPVEELLNELDSRYPVYFFCGAKKAEENMESSPELMTYRFRGNDFTVLGLIDSFKSQVRFKIAKALFRNKV